MSRFRINSLLGAGILAAVTAFSLPAEACGGFFCSQTQPVNQAAERIVFAHNPDGTVTAVIQILYEGPSESFSWLLPISSVPEGDDIAVASDIAFTRLQTATNPQYTLQTVFEGTCKPGPRSGGPGIAAPSIDDSEGGEPPVVVQASGVVGAFEWTVISVGESVADPAYAAVDWLADNGYDVPPGAPALLRPYLDEGLFLLALKLTKGATTGSIRPIVLTYAAERPAIPIKLTQVAANDDMGVLTWVLGAARSVPQNYLSLELNEARINWLNPNSNYNAVVIAAADEAGGQGFVTEYAQPSLGLKDAVFSAADESSWSSFRSTSFAGFEQALIAAYYRWGSWDGFWDAVRATTPFDDAAVAAFQTCPDCYESPEDVSLDAFESALDADVLEPVRLVQRLLDSHAHVTRLYTTLSAAEMTVDPIFTFNPDLPTVSNLHTATRYVNCGEEQYAANEAPWSVPLPQGGVVYGEGATGSLPPAWPAELDGLPATYRIGQAAESGEGRVLEDNSALILAGLGALEPKEPARPTRAPPKQQDFGCALRAPGHSAPEGAAWLGLGVLFAVLRRRQIWPKRV
jgi:hypothetical protein